jgi:hypothetical protein
MGDLYLYSLTRELGGSQNEYEGSEGDEVILRLPQYVSDITPSTVSDNNRLSEYGNCKVKVI